MSRLLMLLVLLSSSSLACAGAPQRQALASTRQALAELDEFGALLLQAGLPAEVIPTERELMVEEAKQLRLRFLMLEPTFLTYGPRLVATLLLGDVEARGLAVSRYELSRRVQDFNSLQVLRPDGYLAMALTGKASQCVGPVEVQDGALRAGSFEVGRFYTRDDRGSWLAVEPLAEPTSAR